MSKPPIAPKASSPHFYKYSTAEHLERLKTIILEHELYLPTLGQSNDPADGRPKLAELSEAQLDSFIRSAFVERNPTLPLRSLEREAEVIRHNVRVHGPDVLLKMLSKILNRELEGYRIYSMSKRPDNLSLWAKYASNHAGYCIEFANEGPLFEHAKDVIYGEAVEMDVTNPEHRSGYWFFCKRPEWSNEEEVRLVGSRKGADRVRFDPAWLTRVILGWRMSNDHKLQVRNWARQRKPELRVVNAVYDELTQKLTLT